MQQVIPSPPSVGLPPAAADSGCPIRALVGDLLQIWTAAILRLMSSGSTFLLSVGYVVRTPWEPPCYAAESTWTLLLTGGSLVRRVAP